MFWEMTANMLAVGLAELGSGDIRTWALAGNLFGMGLIVGWFLAWFTLAGARPESQDRREIDEG